MSHYALALLADPYPQRRDWSELAWLDRLAERLRTALLRLSWQRSAEDAFVAVVDLHETALRALDAPARRQALREIRRDLRRQGPEGEVAARAFAMVRLVSDEILGMRHFPSQLKGGRVLLRGHIAEMDTGEGKTLTATLAAATMALAGNAVHVITVNDYLAQRDAEQMGPVYAALGLTTGLVLESLSTEEKRIQYQADVVFCTSKILTFDYLRDRLELGDRMQPLRMALDQLAGAAAGGGTLLRGLQYAIVDEADSVFIDEARTPLIISSQRPDAAQETFYREALELAGRLVEREDYLVAGDGRQIALTASGKTRLGELAAGLSGLWQGTLRREETVRQALVARLGFRRDIDYIVRDDKVMIVDENTGRVMPDRAWEMGLQQLIELKEGVPVSPEKETLAKISFQLFFRRYLRLAGMSGTCRETAGEIGEVYGLPVVRVEPNRPSRRLTLPAELHASGESRWAAVVEAVRQHTAAGQAVLVGTRSILASETLSALFEAAGIEHRVLNAKQDEIEAAIVAEAGGAGRVTIATNMAGRGTDIKLQPDVEAAGGLHVIITERHDNARVDRQLVGRCARQGDPGSWQAILSLDDELVHDFLPWLRRRLQAALLRHPGRRLPVRCGLAYYRLAQWRVERAHRGIRRSMLGADFRLRKSLSFSGQLE